MIDLSSLPKLKQKKRKRVGRGESSGRGKTSGRGHKGQRSRSGRGIPRGFEGGQTPLKQRLPKFKGIRSKTKKRFAVLTLAQLEKAFAANEVVSLQSLKKKGLIDKNVLKVKLIGDTIKKKLTIKDCLLSKGAKKAFEKVK